MRVDVMEKKTYGTATIGTATPNPTELEVVNFIQAQYVDNRLASICELEDGTFTISIENPKSSGRHNFDTMRLSKESLTGLIFTAMMYWNSKGEDLINMLKESLEKNEIAYRFSDNLKPFNEPRGGQKLKDE